MIAGKDEPWTQTELFEATGAKQGSIIGRHSPDRQIERRALPPVARGFSPVWAHKREPWLSLSGPELLRHRVRHRGQQPRQFLRFATTGLGKVWTAAAAATDDRRQALDQVAGTQA